MLNNQEKRIVSTISYYNELDFPLTAFEIWKHLTVLDEQSVMPNLSLEGILDCLENKELGKYIEEFKGFYFLKGEKELVERRLKRNKIASLKLKRLKMIISLLRLVPFVRMIAVTGRLAMKNSGRNSDWDIFVIIKKGRIWTGRTLVTILTHLIRKRRHGKKIKDRICLNYFITDESLKIDIEGRPFEVNLFSANEYSFMIPLFGFKKFRKFEIRNSWIRNLKPNFELTEVKNMRMISDSHFSKFIRKFGEKLLSFDLIEDSLRKLEKEKIARNPKTHIFGSIIEATDESLVFLPKPQGKEIWERCKDKILKIRA